MQGNSFLRNLIILVKQNWYWFILSVIAMLSLAYYYLKSTDYQYQANALIMLKTDKQQSSGGASESAIFADMGIMSMGAPIESEIYALRSTNLMKKVVEQLGLEVAYSIKPMFRTANIYGASPIEVQFFDKDIIGSQSLIIFEISDNGYSYIVGNDDTKPFLRSNWGDTITIDTGGRFMVAKSPFYGNGNTKEKIKVTLKKKDIVASGLLANLSLIRQDRITGVLLLSAKNTNINEAKDVLNTLINVYNEDVINDKNRAATNTERFISERIMGISADLGWIDSNIEQLKKENIDIVSGALTQTGNTYKNEAIKLETDITVVNFIKDYILEPKNSEDLIPVNTGISDIGIEGQITQYNALRLELDKLINGAGPNNPTTIQKRADLNVLKNNMIHTIENYISTLNIKRRKAINQDNISNRRISSMPTHEKEVNDVVRQQKIKEELYLYLLNKREENALKLAITEPNAKVIEYARGSEFPVFPNMPITFLFSFVAGLLFPLGVILIIEWIRSMDTTIHTKRDIEQNSSLTVIGEIPRKHKGKEKEEILVSEIGRDRISESFRVIRNNIDYVLENDKSLGKVTQITSTFPGEGKSYTTINLAISFAHIGKHVLIIDMDMRKAKLTRMLNMQEKKGISDFLVGKIDNIYSIINKNNDGVANLDVVSSGQIPPNPANLIVSERLDNLIGTLKNSYDYIFIDSVPYMAISDAQSINRIADLTLYVIRNGRVDKEYLSELEQLQNDKKINNLVSLVVDVDMNNKRYGYGYGYDYGYIDNEISDKQKKEIK